MSASGDKVPDATPIVLTPEELRRRNKRSVAIALTLVALCVLFWLITLVKGPAVLNRPL